jgi:hypothetical protein
LFGGWREGLTPTSFIADRPGSYRIELCSRADDSAEGKYEITTQAIRPAGQIDKLRPAAERGQGRSGEELLFSHRQELT